MANVAVELDVRPVLSDFIVQGLEISNSLVLVFQLALICMDLFCGFHVLPLLCPQFDDLSGPKVSEDAMVTDGLPDLVETTLESMHSTNLNVVLGCTNSVLILNSGVLAKDMAIADSINLVARVVVLVFVFMEPEGESALGILLHPFGSKRNTKKSSEEATDIVGGIVAANMAHKGWTCQPLWDSLTPFHNSILDFILQKKPKDLLGDLVGSIGGGRTRNDTNPYDNRTKTPLLLLSQWSMGEKAGRVNRRPFNLPSLDQVTNLGTNSVPNTIEWGVKNSTE